MAKPFLFANLQYEAGNPATISFHDPEQCMRGQSSEILGYYHLPRTTDEEEDPHYTKAFAKGRKVAVNVASIINSDKGPKRDPSVILTNSGLIGGPPCDGHALRTEGITWFEKTHFQPQASVMNDQSWPSTHYLHFSSPVAKIQPGPPPGKGSPQSGLQDVSIVSGMCLFSSSILQSSTSSGRHFDVEKLSRAKPTLYEVEYLARSAPVIADLASILTPDHEQSTRALSISVDVPSFHYYLSVDEHLRNGGSCTFTEALQWMAAVEKRHQQISQVFCRYINYKVSRRRGTSRNFDIQVSPSADLVCQFLRECLAKCVLPSVDDALARLSAEVPTWATFYELVPEKEKPKDFRALGYLFYVYQVLRPALESRRKEPQSLCRDSLCKKCCAPQATPTKLLISVDDAVERRIYSRSQKLLKKLRTLPDNPIDCNLLETYLCRRVFINSNEAGSNLYLDDPSPALPVAKDCRTLADKADDAMGSAQDDETKMDPFDVVKKLYGSSAAEVLEDLFAEVGLGS
ncbi:uncharacterized protein N7459_009528 [Penicillium hispanicum]|uniref:uncharacterized protein n=1 Tax=Penicillium hispanicum TaxID=1080232 RepID=UPI002540E69B|nr:uncharacterized protein N7459_009528 [Penicillium hispanicum]KAJ5570098.1 hypothetical protein N7459_009528 [Penicillium hispanicum]